MISSSRAPSAMMANATGRRAPAMTVSMTTRIPTAPLLVSVFVSFLNIVMKKNMIESLILKRKKLSGQDLSKLPTYRLYHKIGFNGINA